MLGGGDPDDPIIDAALGAQALLANAVQSVGATGFAIVFAVLVIAVLTPVALKSRRVSQTSEDRGR